MKHPTEAVLALYAGGETSWWQRWMVSWHLKQCAACRTEVESFANTRDWFQEAAAEVPGGVEWDRLATEMKANVHVGLAAGEVVASPAPPRRRLGWRAAAALASVTVVAVGSWWLHIPRTVGVSNDVVLAATPAGIELKEEGNALMLMHASSDTAVVSVSAEGSMTARFLDEETGQVTINNVYVE